jgi:hypothetical protein
MKRVREGFRGSVAKMDAACVARSAPLATTARFITPVRTAIGSIVSELAAESASRSRRASLLAQSLARRASASATVAALEDQRSDEARMVLRLISVSPLLA